jgi:hypothetical protein
MRVYCQSRLISASGFSRPSYPHEISILLEIVLDIAVKGVLDRFANAARQVDVRGAPARPPRMLMMRSRGCSCFSASSWWRARRIISSLCSRGEITAQCHHTGREFVVDAPTGRAQFFGDAFALRDPSPPPLVIDGAALRADRTLT